MWVAACQPTPISLSSTPLLTSTSAPPVDLTPAQIGALGALSDSVGAPMGQIAIISTEAVEWSNGCLGVIHDGLVCIAAITPGFRIVLEANRLLYEYHTDQSGNRVISAALALAWHREGADICEDVKVYLSGEVYGTPCNAGGAFPVNKLTTGELKQLTAWAAAFGTTAIEIKDPAAGATLTTQLLFNGSGTGRPGEADQQTLLSWAQAIFERVKPCC